jgi:colanic acid biosynthesis protein WcaH
MRMKKGSRLGDAEFLEVIEKTPLVSVDLVMLAPGSRVLCGLRANEPAKDYWFVPGGRIRKGERIEEAFERIARSELGDCEITFSNAKPIGIFEHFYDSNFLEVKGISTHYVSLGFRIALNQEPTVSADGQHTQLKWLQVGDALGDARVHDYTKELIRAASR